MLEDKTNIENKRVLTVVVATCGSVAVGSTTGVSSTMGAVASVADIIIIRG